MENVILSPIAYISDNDKRTSEMNDFLSLYGDTSDYLCVGQKNNGQWKQWMVKVDDIAANINSETDSYLSVNTFKTNTNSSKKSNISAYRGIYVDIDIHKKDPFETQEYLKYIYSKIDTLFEVLPINLILATGRGFGIYLIYDKPIYNSSIHHVLQKGVINYINTWFESNFDTEFASLDLSCLTDTRVSRIPGTLNTAAGVYCTTLYLDNNKTDYSKLFDIIQPYIVEEVEIPKKKENKASINLTPKITGHLCPMRLVMYCDNQVKWVRKLMAKRGGNEGDYRHNAIWIVYNAIAMKTGDNNLAFDVMEQVNNEFDTPLKDQELHIIANSVDNHREYIESAKRIHKNGFYALSKQRFSEMLCLSTEEEEYIGLYDYEKKLKLTADKREEKKWAKETCISMYKSGCNWKEIQSKIGRSKSTIFDWIKKSQSENETKQEKKVHNRSDVTSIRYIGSTQKSKDKDLRQVWTALKSKRNVLLLGKGGVGKTTVLEEFIKGCINRNKTICKIAPTGLAASNLKGMTAHRLFNLKTGEYSPLDIADNKTYNVLNGIDVLIIDEIGAFRFDYFNYICTAITKVKEIYGKTVRLIVAGDFMQTYPVVTVKTRNILETLWKKDIKTGQIPIADTAFKNMDFKIVTLTKIRRQSDIDFIQKLDELRYGNSDCLSYFNKLRNDLAYFDTNSVHICGHKNTVIKINDHIVNELSTGLKTITYNGESNETIWDCPVYKDLTLFVGCRVMAVKNTKYYKNGQMGTVVKISNKSVRVLFDGDTENTLITPEIFDINNKTYTQIPLIYGYALTVYKAQGQTFNNITVHADDLFGEGSAYVAISRATDINGITLIGNLTKSLIKRENNLIMLDEKSA